MTGHNHVNGSGSAPNSTSSDVTPNATFDTQTEDMSQELPRDKSSQETVTQSSNPHKALQELLKVHDELRIWLNHTGFFDLDHRKLVLDGVRELKGLEAEKSKVLQRIQNSRPCEQSLPVSLLPASADSTPTPKQFHTRDAVYRPPSPSPPRQPSAHVRSRSGGMAPMIRETGQSAHRMATRNADTRYFLVKSSNTTNVYMSRRDGLWITQAKNGPLFTQAFRESKSVVLFFSINKSKAFQGYAIMTSAPDHSIPQPSWIANTTHDMHTTAPFRIDWINDSETPFSQLGDLKNPFNEYNPVFVGRDGQEYPDDCGRCMMGVMDRVKSAQGLRSPVQASGNVHIGRQKSKADTKRRFAALTDASAPGRTPRGAAGLGGSRWKTEEAGPAYLTLDPRPVDHGGEDLLLDYP